MWLPAMGRPCGLPHGVTTPAPAIQGQTPRREDRLAGEVPAGRRLRGRSGQFISHGAGGGGRSSPSKPLGLLAPRPVQAMESNVVQWQIES